MDTMKGLKRTHYCVEVVNAAVGDEVVVCGFVQKRRNLGNLIFWTYVTAPVLCSWPLMMPQTVQYLKKRLGAVQNLS